MDVSLNSASTMHGKNAREIEESSCSCQEFYLFVGTCCQNVREKTPRYGCFDCANVLSRRKNHHHNHDHHHYHHHHYHRAKLVLTRQGRVLWCCMFPAWFTQDACKLGSHSCEEFKKFLQTKVCTQTSPIEQSVSRHVDFLTSLAAMFCVSKPKQCLCHRGFHHLRI